MTDANTDQRIREEVAKIAGIDPADVDMVEGEAEIDGMPAHQWIKAVVGVTVYHFVSRNTETGTRYQKYLTTERDAVNAWCQAAMYENAEPISMDPEPNWSAYTHDGKTPCGNHPTTD
jgi:hypothetical protein